MIHRKRPENDSLANIQYRENANLFSFGKTEIRSYLCTHFLVKKKNRKRAFPSTVLHTDSVLLFLYIFRVDFHRFFRLFSGRIPGRGCPEIKFE